MSIDNEAQRQNLKAANKTLNGVGKALEDFSSLMIDKADFSDTGQKSVKVTVVSLEKANEKVNVEDDKSNIVNLAMKATVDNESLTENKEVSSEQATYYDKNHIDTNVISNSVAGAAKKTYRNTDFGEGLRMAKRYSAVLGAGTVSRHMAVIDTKNRLYFKNKEQTERLNEILGIKVRNRETGQLENSKVSTKEFASDNTHSHLVNDFNNNKRIIDSYLQSRGINGKKLTIREIDKMIGKADKISYEKYSRFHAGEPLDGKLRDKISEINAQLFKQGTGKAGKGPHGVVIDDQLREILKEKRWQLEMQSRINQIQRSPGGVKNFAKSWTNEMTRDSDFETGMQTVKTVTTTMKATAVVAEGAVTVASTAAVTAAELTGRATASVGHAGINMGGRIYARGDQAKSLAWKNKTSKATNSFDKLTNNSKVIGREGRKIIGQNTKAAVSFTSASPSRKVRVVTNTMANGARWVFVNTAGRTKAGQKVMTGYKKATDKVKGFASKIRGGFNKIQNNIYNHTKLIRAPFSAVNAVQRAVKKVAIHIGVTVGLAFLSCSIVLIAVMIVPIIFSSVLSFFTSLMPAAFMADSSYEITNQVGQETINAMLVTQTEFLKEVEDYMDRTCTLTDAEGNKLHSHHNAYFLKYMGDNTDDFENLSSTTVPTSDTYTMMTGETSSYNIEALYRTIISMATVATGNEAQEKDFYVDYSRLLLEKILHTAKFSDCDGRVPIILTDTGITDAMKLDQSVVDPSWCDDYFPAVDDGWMHTHGVDSLEYSEWLRHEENYNTWHGWNVEDMASYDWAVTLWEMSSEDWSELGIVLPGSVGGGDNGAAFKPTLVSNTVDKLKEQGYSELRVKAIEVALNEVGKHIYGVRSDSSYFPYTLDCSDFISGVLLAANVPGAQDATTGGMVKLYPHLSDGDEVVPGTIMVFKDTSGTVVNGQVHSDNHVVMYIGAVEGYGDYCVIECSDKTTYRNGEPYVKVDGVSVSGFTSFEQLRAEYPYRYYLNPYGD